MPVDYNKPRGSTPGSRPTAGNANIRSVPVFGIVKDNIDPIRAGRLKVYLSDFSGTNPDDSNSWVTVSYMSTFFGSVRPKAGETGVGTYKDNPSSYGEWHAPPDIGTTVICIFINGDMNYGFYIGCVPDPESLRMVPAIGAMDTVVPNSEEARKYGGASRLPVTNINTNNDSIAESAGFIASSRPVHSYSAAIMAQQGVIRDNIRGPISSSSQREPCSRVGWGVSTPGRPIYEGGFDDQTIVTDAKTASPESLRIVARRGGHSIVMDDGDAAGNDQLVRIRTALGHQITMSDDGQTLSILHSNGQSYIELGKEGTVDVYSTNSVNIRTQGDLNLHADNNVNIHATKDLNIHAENMNVATTKSLKQSIGLNYITSALGLATLKTVGAMSFASVGPASFSSTFLTFINGALINLNTGKSPVRPLDVTPVPLTVHTDTLFSEATGFAAAPGKLVSVTSRAPAHMPWAHAGQGVDIKTDLTGASQSSKKPSSLVSRVVKTAAAAGAKAIKLPTALSVPNISNISKSLTETATRAMVGVAGQNAATGIYSAAVQTGSTIVNTAAGKVAAVGAFARSPLQLEAGGVIKPGSAELVSSLISSGANITQSMPSSLFTGSPGGENLQSYITNIQPQTNTVVTNLRQSQSSLINAGVITGNEDASQIAGLVYSGATSGIDKTIAVARTVTNKNTPESSIIRDIGMVTASTVLADSSLGGNNALSISVNEMQNLDANVSTDTGTAEAAFSAITNSFPELPAGVSVNLPNINDAKQAITNLAAGVPLFNPSSAIASGVNNLAGGFNSVASVKNAVLGKVPLPGTEQLGSLINGSATNALNSITGSLTGGLSGITGSLTGGLSGITGSLSSLGSLSSVVNITSAIGSIKSLFGGKGGVRTVSVGVNTTNRAPLEKQVKSLLNDPKIPSPNFTDKTPASVTSALERKEATNKEIRENNTKIQKLTIQVTAARNELRELRSQLPAGDARIAQAKQKADALTTERQNLVRTNNTLISGS